MIFSDLKIKLKKLKIDYLKSLETSLEKSVVYLCVQIIIKCYYDFRMENIMTEQCACIEFHFNTNIVTIHLNYDGTSDNILY